MGKALVGAARFELATYWSQTSRATKLRYTPIVRINIRHLQKKTIRSGLLILKKHRIAQLSAKTRFTASR